MACHARRGGRRRRRCAGRAPGRRRRCRCAQRRASTRCSRWGCSWARAARPPAPRSRRCGRATAARSCCPPAPSGHTRSAAVASRHQLHAHGRRGAAHKRRSSLPQPPAELCQLPAPTGVLTLHLDSREVRLTVRLTVHEPLPLPLPPPLPRCSPRYPPRSCRSACSALGHGRYRGGDRAVRRALPARAHCVGESRAGIHERPPPGVVPIAAQTGGGELDKAPEVHFAFERSLAVGALGLPEQITVKGAELLAAPISVRAQVEKVQVEWRASRPVALANGTAAGVRWEAEGWARRIGPQTPPLSCAARARRVRWGRPHRNSRQVGRGPAAGLSPRALPACPLPRDGLPRRAAAGAVGVDWTSCAAASASTRAR